MAEAIASVLLGKAIKIVLEEIKKLREFSYQLGVISSHLETYILPLLKQESCFSSAVDKDTRPFDDMRLVVENLTTAIQKFNKSGMLTLDRDTMRTNVTRLFSELELKQRSLLLILQVSGMDAAERHFELVKKNFEVASLREKELLDRLNAVGERLDEYVSHVQRNRIREAEKGSVVSFFEEIADEISSSDSPWLSSETDFHALMVRLKNLSNRQMMLNLRDYSELSTTRLRLIQESALSTLREVEPCLRRLATYTQGSCSDIDELLEGLDEKMRRIKELRLSVSFIGPTKAGKSTSINAILGFRMAPHQILPCTVLPTAFRHTVGQSTPRLLLSEPAIKIFEDTKVSIREKASTLYSNCILPDSEKYFLDRIVAAVNLPVFKQVTNDEIGDAWLQGINEVLSFCNFLCRLYAYGQSLDPPLFNEDRAYNPLILINENKCWPVVELEMELLRDKQILGTFELVDSPGRDEVELIPSIQSAVETVIKNSAAVVCVLNCTTYGNDGTTQIQRELIPVFRNKRPIFLLANKIDLVPTERERDTHEQLIGATFLKKTPGSTGARQVFGVSSTKALDFAVTNRLLHESERDILDVCRHLPESIVRDESTLGCIGKISKDDISMLLKLLKEYYGKREWQDKARAASKETLSRMAQDVIAESRFDAFIEQLMDELAPQSGQIVLAEELNNTLSHLHRINERMDRNLCLMMAAEDNFKERQKSAMSMISKLRSAIDGVIPVKFDSLKDNFQRELEKKNLKFSDELRDLIDTKVQEIADSNCIQNFPIRDEPTSEQLHQYQFLKCVEGSKYWEFSTVNLEAQRSELQTALRSFIEKDFVVRYRDWTLDMQQFVSACTNLLIENVLKSIEDVIESSDLRGIVGSRDKTLIKFDEPKLFNPNEDIAVDAVDKRTKKRWYTLWLIETDSIFTHKKSLLSLKRFHELTLERLTEMMEDRKKSVLAQSYSYFDKIRTKIIRELNSRVDRVEEDLRNICDMRKKDRSKEEIQRLAHDRVFTEGLSTELNILKHNAETHSPHTSNLRFRESFDNFNASVGFKLSTITEQEGPFHFELKSDSPDGIVGSVSVDEENTSTTTDNFFRDTRSLPPEIPLLGAAILPSVTPKADMKTLSVGSVVTVDPSGCPKTISLSNLSKYEPERFTTDSTLPLSDTHLKVPESSAVVSSLTRESKTNEIVSAIQPAVQATNDLAESLHHPGTYGYVIYDSEDPVRAWTCCLESSKLSSGCQKGEPRHHDCLVRFSNTVDYREVSRSGVQDTLWPCCRECRTSPGCKDGKHPRQIR